VAPGDRGPREIPPRLLARGVISRETAKRLESLAGFRNVLVHGYAEAGSAGSPPAGLHQADPRHPPGHLDRLVERRGAALEGDDPFLPVDCDPVLARVRMRGQGHLHP